MTIRFAVVCLLLALGLAPLDSGAAENRCVSIEPNPLDPDNLHWEQDTGVASIDITAMEGRYPGETYAGTLTRSARHTNGRTRYNFVFKTPYANWRQEAEYILIPSSPPKDPDVYYLRAVMYTYENEVRHLDILVAGLEVRCTFATPPEASR